LPSRSALVLRSRGDPGILSIFKKIASPFVEAGQRIARTARQAGQTFIEGVSGGGGGVPQTKTAQVMARPTGRPQLAQMGVFPGVGAAAARVATAGARAVARVSAGTLPAKAGKILAGGALFELGGLIFDAVTGEFVEKKKVRRMNVLNPRALSRATRRLSGFNKRSKNVEKQLRRLAPAARRRTAAHHFDHHDHISHH